MITPTVKNPVTLVGSVIAFVQAVILFVNVFDIASISGEQGAAITGVVTAAFALWAARKHNDQVEVALYSDPPE